MGQRLSQFTSAKTEIIAGSWGKTRAGSQVSNSPSARTSYVSGSTSILGVASLCSILANVLTKGSVLTDNLIMQRILARTQCIAHDASVAGAIIRMFQYYQHGERLKF
jgi:hypothetical protein